MLFRHGFEEQRDGCYKVRDFEDAFAAAMGSSHALAVTSGTAALRVALAALDIGPGDEVITQSFTFVATVEAIIESGATPVCAEIDETLNLDPADLEQRINERTRAVIVVHMLGSPARLREIRTVCDAHDLYLIEDTAWGCGGSLGGVPLGTWGEVGTFSFDFAKTMTTGEGGMVLFASGKHHERGAAWHDHGHENNPEVPRWEDTRSGSGFNYRMTEFQAALLLSQMRNLEPQADLRSKNAALLADHLSDIEGIEPLLVDDRVTRHAYHLYVLRYDGAAFGGATRDRFIEALCAEGVPGAAGYRPLYREPAFQERFRDYPLDSPAFGGKPDYSQVDCPVTERICADEAVWLTQNLLLGSEQDIAHIAEAVRKIQQSSDQLAG